MSSSSYLAVLKALYDYETPQSDDELAIKEDQLLFLLEKVDEDWWKVKIKPDSPDEDGPSGLVPVAYVEEVPHKQVVKALYDYDANASGELTIKEDELLYSYDTDEGWTLVRNQKGGTVGYVPGNYIEEVDENGTAASPPPSSPSPPQSPVTQPTVPISSPPPQHILTGEKGKADDIQTWSLSELDKKGKKKKGTLGVGGGAVFFASETDKTPVRKWPISDVDAVKTEKGKHVVVEIGGSEPTVLRFHAGSKDTAESILKKLERSIDLPTEVVQAARVVTPPTASQTPTPPALPPIQTAPPPTHVEETKKNTVHFAVSSPSIITRSEDGEEELPEGAAEGVALYDFTAGGDDELTVNEGDHLLVLDRSNEDWWTCRDQHGLEGVVPASYIELAEGAAQLHVEARGHEVEEEDESELIASREATEREEMLREEELRREEEEREEREARERSQRKEREEQEAKRKDREKTEARKRESEKRREQEKRDAIAAAVALEKTNAARAEDESREEEKRARRAERKAAEKSEKSRPVPKTTRTWHDKTGQFQVDAEFLGQRDNKLRLHKANGVTIEVPVSKMSAEDMEYVRRLQKKKAASASRSSGRPADSPDGDDVPLGSLSTAQRKASSSAPRATEARAPQRKAPTVDWFEFFLNAGCDIDECTRYASAFERDKIDESLLGELKEGTLRSLGLKEGDILRVLKAIQQRTKSSEQGSEPDKRRQSQMEQDERFARELQAQENGEQGPRRQGSASPAPNLFAGPGGALKNNTRRGRPQPSKSAPPINVDIGSIGSGQTTNLLLDSPQTLTPVQAPKRTTSTTPSQFDDDAWTNRPSSTAPIAPSPAAPAAPTPSPLPLAPAQAPVPVAAPAQSPPSQTSPSASTSPASAVQGSDFELLAKIAAMKSALQNPAAPSPPVQAPPPAGFQSGLGVGISNLPLSQHLQNQQTGLYNLPQSQARGPLAPTASNQPLLNPLIPTNTGFNSFIPTRPGTNPPPVPALPSYLTSPQNFRPQSNPINPIAAQPTGFVPSGFGGMQPQPTGFPSGGFGGFQSNPSFMGNGSPMQTGPTGSPPGIFPNFMPPAASPPPDNHSPANIFAQMKSGTFGKDDAPQNADKYDALRTNNPSQLAPQPTGWGMQPNFSSYPSYGQ